MAITRKVLGQSAPSAATLTTLYTVPSATTTVTSTLVVANRSSVSTLFRVAVRPLGAAISNQHYIYYDVEIPGGDTFASTIGMTLTATDVVSVYSTLATVSFTLFGEETS